MTLFNIILLLLDNLRKSYVAYEAKLAVAESRISHLRSALVEADSDIMYRVIDAREKINIALAEDDQALAAIRGEK